MGKKPTSTINYYARMTSGNEKSAGNKHVLQYHARVIIMVLRSNSINVYAGFYCDLDELH